MKRKYQKWWELFNKTLPENVTLIVPLLIANETKIEIIIHFSTQENLINKYFPRRESRSLLTSYSH